MNVWSARKASREGTKTPDQADAAGDRSSTSVPAGRGRKPARPRVGWIATTAIVLMLLIGAGWELLHWLLLVVTLD